MHKSTNSNNFRNKKYLDNMDHEFKTMFRAYHKYIAYRNKLLDELVMSEEDVERMASIDRKMVRNITKASKRIEMSDFKQYKKEETDE